MSPAGSDGPPAPPPPPAARIGTVVAQRYRILAVLGEGGMGTVYLAEDVVLRLRVAVKLLKQELSTEATVVARFEREANAMLTLAHEHVVQALAFGRTPEGELCLVMELVEGETLRDTLTRLKPLALHTAVEIARQMGEGLTRAHALGIVHRDLKPENVMVAWRQDGFPHIKILDFGMARILGGTFGLASPLTRKGSVFGTPEYMCPEQAMGMPVEPAADQYALGVMLFEMVAGRRPFSADTPLDMVQLQIHQAPPRLTDVAPAVPSGVADVVALMMAKTANGRFPSVAMAMDALVAAATPVARPTPQEPVTGAATATDPAGVRRWWQKLRG